MSNEFNRPFRDGNWHPEPQMILKKIVEEPGQPKRMEYRLPLVNALIGNLEIVVNWKWSRFFDKLGRLKE